jgi:L-asparaginase
MKILLLQTGGTVDKDYPTGDENHGYSFVITTPAYERILRRINPKFPHEKQTVLRKDSLDITDEERKLILDTCIQSQHKKIVITHGTDTMIQTAELLSQIEDKAIVLTGAMTPELFKNSDADFNLGSAIGAVTVLDKGVYIAMHGRILQWNEVVFNSASGEFVSKYDQ